jgi:hypothetical protein
MPAMWLLAYRSVIGKAAAVRQPAMDHRQAPFLRQLLSHMVFVLRLPPVLEAACSVRLCRKGASRSSHRRSSGLVRLANGSRRVLAWPRSLAADNANGSNRSVRNRSPRTRACGLDDADRCSARLHGCPERCRRALAPHHPEASPQAQENPMSSVAVVAATSGVSRRGQKDSADVR